MNAIKKIKHFLAAKYYEAKDIREFKSLKLSATVATNLAPKENISKEAIFNNPETDKNWEEASGKFKKFEFPATSGSMNEGDRRALFYLLSALKPSSVLEIGTHLGASTLHIASALAANNLKSGMKALLTTVDIIDVNSEAKKHWLEYGGKESPRDILKKCSYEDIVDFVTDGSLHFLAAQGQKYDFIFLDGDHAASTVYKEVPLALQLLNPGGIILLHDYYPGNKPLWSDKAIISGPYLAISRFISEGAEMEAMPLGELPWPTKLGSKVTSLALLVKK